MGLHRTAGLDLKTLILTLKSKNRMKCLCVGVVHPPVDEQVLLHPEAVCAAIAVPGVALRAPGRAGLPRVGGRVLVVAVRLRQLSALAPQGGVLAGLLTDPGSVDDEGVLEGSERERVPRQRNQGEASFR